MWPKLSNINASVEQEETNKEKRGKKHFELAETLAYVVKSSLD